MPGFDSRLRAVQAPLADFAPRTHLARALSESRASGVPLTMPWERVSSRDKRRRPQVLAALWQPPPERTGHTSRAEPAAWPARLQAEVDLVPFFFVNLEFLRLPLSLGTFHGTAPSRYNPSPPGHSLG